VAEVLGDLVQRAALVEEQRGARVAEVVAAEVSDACAFERGDPDATTPVVSAQVSAPAVGKDELVRLRPSTREVELDKLARDRLEELRLAAALRLRRGDLAAGDGLLHTQAPAWPAAIVEDVTPDERVRLGRPQAFVGEDTDERGVLRVELRADRLDRLRCASVDRLRAGVRDPADTDHGIPGKPSPLDGAMEDTLEDAERAVDRRRAGPVDAELRRVRVDRLARDFAQALAAEVGDDPLVEQGRVSGEGVRAQVCGRVGVPPLDEKLLEGRVRADHFGGELAKLARAAERGLEELGVAATVERALPPRAAAAALIPADDVGAAAVASRGPLDTHAGFDRSRLAKDTPAVRARRVSCSGSGDRAVRVRSATNRTSSAGSKRMAAPRRTTASSPRSTSLCTVRGWTWSASATSRVVSKPIPPDADWVSLGVGSDGVGAWCGAWLSC
jgi:hypothetical protein